MSTSTRPPTVSAPEPSQSERSFAADGDLRRWREDCLRRLAQIRAEPMSDAEVQAELRVVPTEALDRLGKYLDDLAGDPTPPMSHHEIQEEIRPMRTERRS